jgi:hypothetical protein
VESPSSAASARTSSLQRKLGEMSTGRPAHCPRLLLAFAALLLAFGGVMHAAAFDGALAALAGVELPPFYAGSFKRSG